MELEEGKKMEKKKWDRMCCILRTVCWVVHEWEFVSPTFPITSGCNRQTQPPAGAHQSQLS